MRIIKKYANRHLYDSHECRYINVSDLIDLVRVEADFKVIDSSTGNDVTVDMLLGSIFNMKSQSQFLDVETLVGLVRSLKPDESLFSALNAPTRSSQVQMDEVRLEDRQNLI